MCFNIGDWINLLELIPQVVWNDIGDSWTGSIPVGDAVWHYGPARLWATVVNSDSYGKVSVKQPLSKRPFLGHAHFD